MNKSHNAYLLKYVSLVTLTLQNALVGLSMRYARTRAGDMFLSSTAVLMAEVVKLITCLFIVFIEEGSFSKFVYAFDTTIIKQPKDTLKVCMPSLLYVIQNNLLYLSASNLDAATYQVTYQLKILTTAFFAVVILKRSLLRIQWGALLILLAGVILVQLAHSENKAVPSGMDQNRLVGFSAALAACFLSGFAGIYFEKILKGSQISIWMRNVQLSFLSLPIGFLTCHLNDGNVIENQGFFFGYDWFVVYLVILQACGGLIVAMVVKHADNILKGFATSLAIVISCIASIYLFDFQLTFQFSIGAIFVICSIFMYSHQPKTACLNKHLNSDKV
ncbi:PREDICTED: UDP-galactose translocator [Ceratosolen solmsi marchali]|uniref:UDP-galactose translocator n=1 Tax=Ceratosolen solmsi marchali TaxID=326594 RepID=A0AAJ6YKJ3_9HYME|nr:PREDICTED: UDP-galactose translocator [Ceratosolen solmsi marchali]